MRRSVKLGLVAAALSGLLTAVLPSAPASAIAGLTATFTKTGDWGTGYEGKYTVNNQSGSAVTWKVEFDVPAGSNISSMWDAQFTKSGNHVVVVGNGWNASVGNGGSVSFGWIGSPGGFTPANCTVNGGPCSGAPSDTTPPSNVSGLNSPSKTHNSIALSWSAATDTGGSGLAGYNIYRNGSTTPITTTGTGTTFTDTGLAASTVYTYTVKARDGANNVSVAHSNQISVTTSNAPVDTTPPTTPGTLSSTGKTSSSINLSWGASTDAGGSGLAGYNIYRNGSTTPITTNGTATTYSDSGLSANTTYTYKVKARDGAGNVSTSFSNEISVTTDQVGTGSYKKIAYFAQWGIYGRNFKVKDLDTTGMAAKLTHIHYAFANINEQGQCFQANQLGQGDAWADYQRRFAANETVNGQADVYNQPLAGNFNQLKQLKAKYPHLKVILSLGGWTWSKYFSNAALPANRQAFVNSCVDMFIKGNLPIFGGESQGGPGSGAGVFDGIDIDWEWPSAEGNTGNVIRPEDKANLTATVNLLRSTLDNYGASIGKQYSISAFLPADVAKLDLGWDVPALMSKFDYATVQGYDFYGAWEGQTNHQSQLYNPAANPHARKYSVDTIVSALLSRGAPASKLSIGIPAYGRGWTNVAAGGNNGLYQTGTAAPGTYEAGIEDYKVLKNRPGTVYRDNVNGAVWKYDGTTWWSYDDPQLIAMKAAYVKSKGLGGMMIWEADGDDGTITTAIANGLA